VVLEIVSSETKDKKVLKEREREIETRLAGLAFITCG
jgi:hypothetical protein